MRKKCYFVGLIIAISFLGLSWFLSIGNLSIEKNGYSSSKTYEEIKMFLSYSIWLSIVPIVMLSLSIRGSSKQGEKFNKALTFTLIGLGFVAIVIACLVKAGMSTYQVNELVYDYVISIFGIALGSILIIIGMTVPNEELQAKSSLDNEIEAKLAKLAEMHNEKLISDEEYDSLKKKYLEKM